MRNPKPKRVRFKRVFIGLHLYRYEFRNAADRAEWQKHNQHRYCSAEQRGHCDLEVDFPRITIRL